MRGTTAKAKTEKPVADHEDDDDAKALGVWEVAFQLAEADVKRIASATEPLPVFQATCDVTELKQALSSLFPVIPGKVLHNTAVLWNLVGIDEVTLPTVVTLQGVGWQGKQWLSFEKGWCDRRGGRRGRTFRRHLFSVRPVWDICLRDLVKTRRCCRLSPDPSLLRRVNLVFTSSGRRSWRMVTLWCRRYLAGDGGCQGRWCGTCSRALGFSLRHLPSSWLCDHFPCVMACCAVAGRVHDPVLRAFGGFPKARQLNSCSSRLPP